MRRLRVLAVAEATTLLLLVCAAVPLKYGAGLPIATSIVGPMHGVAFALFIWATLEQWGAGAITGAEARRLVLGSFVPLGGLINERWLRHLHAERTHL